MIRSISTFILMVSGCLLFAQNNKAIQLTTKLNNSYHLEQKSDSDIYLYVSLLGNELKTEKKRAPLNISLVLDRSGSMSGAKIENAKKAMNFVIDQLSATDYLSIVEYDDRVNVISASALVKNKDALKQKVNEITVRGSTNLFGGMMKGFDEVLTTKKDGYVNRVLLVSDGLANVGTVLPATINDSVKSMFKKTGIGVSTFGVGADFNEDLMTSIAENGNGNYYFIDTATKIPAIFAKELDGLLSVVAQQTTLEIKYPDNLKVEKVYGYNHTDTNHTITVLLNDIYSKEAKEVLVHFKLIKPIADKITLQTQVYFTDAQLDKTDQLFTSTNLAVTRDTIIYKANIDSLVDEMVIVYNTTEMMDKAMQEIDKGNYAAGFAFASKAEGVVVANSYRVKTGKVQKQKEAITKYKNDVKDIETKSSEDRKMIQKSTKQMNYNIKKNK